MASLIEPDERTRAQREFRALVSKAIDPESLGELLAIERDLKSAIDRRIGELMREGYGKNVLAVPCTVTGEALRLRARRVG